MQTKNPHFESDVRESFAEQKLMRTFGATLLRVAPGEVEIELLFDERLLQQTGSLHAGAIAAIADSACGYAALTLMPPESEVMSIEFKLNLLSPAISPRFIARGRVVRAGKTITVCTADVIGTDGEDATLVATMLATMIRRNA